jgi:signal transduction histidine kinase
MHDLRTPLAVVSGHVQLMVGAGDAAARADHARVIARQFDLVAAMQREVLEFARGERSVLLRKVFLEKFFAEIEHAIRREIEGTRIVLALELRDRGTARFDELKVERLLANLTRNAIEAMNARGGKLTVRAERDGDDLVLTVADEGPGIPDEVRAKLFGAFVTAGKPGGTGLGLSIVKKIVEEHRGTVSVTTGAQGTTFTVRIPQVDPEEAAPRHLVEEASPRGGAPRKAKTNSKGGAKATGTSRSNGR